MVDTVVSFTTPQSNSFKDIAFFSNLSYYCKSFKSLKVQKKTLRWPDLLSPDFLIRDRCRALYKPPIEGGKRTADLQWMIIYCAIATDGHVNCRFCGAKEDIESN